MTFALVVTRIHLPHARSLKHKRRVVKSLIDRVHQRYRASIAETDFHDVHQRAEIAIALVGRDQRELERLLDGIRRLFDQELEADVADWLVELVEGAR